MMRLRCILETLCAFAIVHGCDYREIDCRDPRIDLLQCHRCGRFEASWRYGDKPPAGWRTA